MNNLDSLSVEVVQAEVVKPPEDVVITLSKEDGHYVASSLASAFVWKDNAEGQDFWHKIYEAFMGRGE